MLNPYRTRMVELERENEKLKKENRELKSDKPEPKKRGGYLDREATAPEEK